MLDAAAPALGRLRAPPALRGAAPGADADAVGFDPPSARPRRRPRRGTRTLLATGPAAPRREDAAAAAVTPCQRIHRRPGGAAPRSPGPRGGSGEEDTQYRAALLLASLSDAECSPEGPARQAGPPLPAPAALEGTEEYRRERFSFRTPSSSSAATANAGANSHAATPLRSNGHANPYWGEYPVMHASSSWPPPSPEVRDSKVAGTPESYQAPLPPHFSRGAPPPMWSPGPAPPAPYGGAAAGPPAPPAGHPYGPSYPPRRLPLPTFDGRAPAALYPRHPPPDYGPPPPLPGPQREPPCGTWDPYAASRGPERVRSDGDPRPPCRHVVPAEPPSPGYPAAARYGAAPRAGEGYPPPFSPYTAVSRDDGSPSRAAEPLHAAHTPPRGPGSPLYAARPGHAPPRGPYAPYHAQQGQAPTPRGYAPPPPTPGGYPYPYPHPPSYGRHALPAAGAPDPYAASDHAEVPAAVSHEGEAPAPRRRPGAPPPPPAPHQFRQGERSVRSPPVLLRRKFSWRNYPELEAYLLAHRAAYLRHSALNYTAAQKRFNNRLTEGLLARAAMLNYVFDEGCFGFVAVRDRIRCYYKSYVQSAKKRGVAVGYGKPQAQGEGARQGGRQDAPTESTGETESYAMRYSSDI